MVKKIVVGIDGSEVSKRALAWAIDYASGGDLVRAVYIWQVYRGARPDIVPVEDLEQLRPQADRFVGEVVGGDGLGVHARWAITPPRLRS